MERFIPYEKLSKKQKHEWDKRKRNQWEINPTTRQTEERTKYSRKRTRQELQKAGRDIE